MRGLRWRVGILSLSAAFAIGCSSSEEASPESLKSPWPGFQLLGGLGARCTASVASAPETEYQPLTFIPCASGVAGCGELQFDGVVGAGTPNASSLYAFAFSVAFDEQGKLSRLLVVRKTTAQEPVERVPLEAVAYDVPTGAPLFGLRNNGDAVDWNSSSVGFGSNQDCSVVPVLGSNMVSWMAAPSGHTRLLVGQSALAPVELPLDLREAAADPSAMDRLLASDELLAANQPDGRIHRFRFDGTPDVSSYGPDVKVTLSQAVAGDVFVASSQFQAYRLTDDGQFVGSPGEMSSLHIAGGKAAWVSHAEAGLGYSVWVSDYVPDLATLDAQKTKLADVMDFRGLALGDGWVAVGTAADMFGNGLEVRAYDLATSATRSVKLQTQPLSAPTLLAVVGEHVWLSTPAILTGSAGLERHTLTPD